MNHYLFIYQKPICKCQKLVLVRSTDKNFDSEQNIKINQKKINKYCDGIEKRKMEFSLHFLLKFTKDHSDKIKESKSEFF
ncbi:hypothetical protein BpHYR1_018291 [Brachionus plicatilis]|uniref:Uncharacterized protein n=1 Tax=Brachionus plicatilis TaxID=10195 RepID=A0A3M7P9Y2_BRAPC|nr:hypothetical protein BpHYR1_018291 [Brachionus plicatilis]